MNHEQTISDFLAENVYFPVSVVGLSMYPMLLPGDMLLFVRPTHPIQRNSIVLYCRADHYVVHRLLFVGRRHCIINGDNSVYLERDIRYEDIIAVLSGYWRNNTYFDCNSAEAQRFARRAAFSRPKRLLKGVLRINDRQMQSAECTVFVHKKND